MGYKKNNKNKNTIYYKRIMKKCKRKIEIIIANHFEYWSAAFSSFVKSHPYSSIFPLSICIVYIFSALFRIILSLSLVVCIYRMIDPAICMLDSWYSEANFSFSAIHALSCYYSDRTFPSCSQYKSKLNIQLLKTF